MLGSLVSNHGPRENTKQTPHPPFVASVWCLHGWNLLAQKNDHNLLATAQRSCFLPSPYPRLALLVPSFSLSPVFPATPTSTLANSLRSKPFLVSPWAISGCPTMPFSSEASDSSRKTSSAYEVRGPNPPRPTPPETAGFLQMPSETWPFARTIHSSCTR